MLTCILCKKQLQDQNNHGKDPYPMRGLAFETLGHYGSSVFDSMYGTKLTVCVCDPCLRENKQHVYGTGKTDASWEPYKP